MSACTPVALPELRPDDLKAAERILAERLVERIEARGCTVWLDPSDGVLWVNPYTSLTVELHQALEAYTQPVIHYLESRRREAGLIA